MSKPASPAPEDSGRRYAGESPAQRSARRRQQFLDAGLHVFGHSGYRNATLRLLCRQAELTDRYFYESFQTLEDLLIAVYQREFDQLRAAVQAAFDRSAPPGDPMAAVREGIEVLFDMASDPAVARVCWLEVLGVSPRVDDLYIRTLSDFAALVVQRIRLFFPAWRIADDEAAAIGIAAVGSISQTVTHWVLTGYRTPRSTLVSATARVFEGLILVIDRPA